MVDDRSDLGVEIGSGRVCEFSRPTAGGFEADDEGMEGGSRGCEDLLMIRLSLLWCLAGQGLPAAAARFGAPSEISMRDVAARKPLWRL